MTETSTRPPLRGIVGEATKGKIGVLVEEHFDMTEYRLFNELFPKHGYQVVYLSHLWGNANLTFGSNPDNGWVEEHVLVETEINSVKPADFKGLIISGAYASDRLRYQAAPRKGEPNQTPAVVSIRQAAAHNGRVALAGLAESIRDTMEVTGFLKFFTCLLYTSPSPRD